MGVPGRWCWEATRSSSLHRRSSSSCCTVRHHTGLAGPPGAPVWLRPSGGPLAGIKALRLWDTASAGDLATGWRSAGGRSATAQSSCHLGTDTRWPAGRTCGPNQVVLDAPCQASKVLARSRSSVVQWPAGEWELEVWTPMRAAGRRRRGGSLAVGPAGGGWETRNHCLPPPSWDGRSGNQARGGSGGEVGYPMSGGARRGPTPRTATRASWPAAPRGPPPQAATRADRALGSQPRVARSPAAAGGTKRAQPKLADPPGQPAAGA